jgi:hypothetical protein
MRAFLIFFPYFHCMRKLMIHVSVLFVILSSISCNSSEKYNDFVYIPLEEYKYEQAIIQPGTELELLAFSGGKKEFGEEIYYYQFLVLDKSTGDTLRIMTPLISVDETAGSETKTHTTPFQYDPEKRITTAYYEPMDSSKNLLLNASNLIKNGEVDSTADLSRLMTQIDKKQFVVVNKSMPEFVNPRFRSAIGILNFKEIPW